MPVKPFNEIASKWDPMMPQEQYDSLRDHYFNSFVKPSVSKHYDVEATRKKFYEETERPSMFKNSMEKATFQMVRGGLATAKSAVAPFMNMGDKPAPALQSMRKAEDKLNTVARREGMTNAPVFVGDMVGSLLPLAVATEGAEPIAEGILTEGIINLKNAATVTKLARGGLAFGAYEAANAEHGDRIMAGLKGVAFGAAAEGTFSLAGKLASKGVASSPEETDKIVKELMKVKENETLQGPPQTSKLLKADRVIAQDIQQSAQTAKAEGRPMVIRDDPSFAGVKLFMRGKDGRPLTLPIEGLTLGDKSKDIETVIDKLQHHLKIGGSIEGMSYHPEAHGMVNQLVKELADRQLAKYENFRVLRTGSDGKVVSSLLQNGGVPAEASGDHVIVNIPVKDKPTRVQLNKVAGELKDSEGFALNKFDREQLMDDVIATWSKNINPTRLSKAMSNPNLTKMADFLPDDVIEQLKPDREVGPPKELAKVPDHDTKVLTWIKEMSDENGGQLNLTEKLHAKDRLEVLWDSSIPKDSVMKRNALSVVKQFGVPDELLPPAYRNAGVEPVEDLIKPAPQPTTPVLGSVPGDDKLEALIKQMRANPDDIDLDLLRATGAEEVARAAEIAEKGKDIKAPGLMEEAVRKGEIVGQPTIKLRIPASEETPLAHDGKGGIVISENAVRQAVKLSSKQIEQLHPGAHALLVDSKTGGLVRVLEELGINPTRYGIEGSKKPVMAYSKMNKDELYHEGLHALIDHGIPKGLVAIHMDEGLGTAIDIANGLKGHKAYSTLNDFTRIEEAYVHSASAIRSGDEVALANLARMDTSTEKVINMVNEASASMLKSSHSMADSMPVRMFQRKMEDLLRRTSTNKVATLRDAAEQLGRTLYLDADRKLWTMMDRAGNIQHYPASDLDIFKTLDEDIWGAQAFAPNPSGWAEMRGVRGPFIPEGQATMSKNPPMPDFTPDPKWKWPGLQAILGAIRPMGSWVGKLDEKLNNELFLYKGKSYKFPIYDKWKAVDESIKEGDDWLQKNYEAAAKFLQGDSKKLESYFTAMTTTPDKWEGLAKTLNLDQKDLLNLQHADEWLKNFRNETGINPFNWLRDEYPRLRSLDFNTERVYGQGVKDAKEMSFFHKGITEGSFNGQDAHLGRFTNFLIRQGMEKKFYGKPLEELKKLVNLQTAEGKYVLGSMRWPLDNYVKYIQGIPDMTQQVITRGVSDFQVALGEKFAEMNKHLPEGYKLPEKFNYPGSVINRFMLFSYVAGLGMRPAIALRDAMQVFMTALPVLGPEKFMKGLAKTLTSDGIKAAADAGALLNKTNIGELYGDIFHEIPPHSGGVLDKATQLANRLLSPSRWGHNIGRAVAYHSEFDSALDAVNGFRAGRYTAGDVLDKTSLWFADKPAQTRILGMIQDKGIPAQDVARKTALELVDLTQWPYRRGAQPTLLRTGLGRIFGQYGMWPMNYMDFLARMGSKYAENPKRAMRATALWGATNFAAVSAFKSIGADTQKWFFLSPAGYGMSPHAQFVHDLMIAPEETKDGRDARKRVLEYPLNFVPSSLAMQNIMQAIQSGEPMFDGDGKPTASFLKVMGFHPEALKDPTANMDLDDRALYELGYDKHGSKR